MGEEEAIAAQQSGQVDTESQVQQEAQADAQPSEQHPMESLLHADYDVHSLRRGQIVEGVIVQVRPSEILVDVGAKSEGVIWGREIERLGSEGLADLNEGQSVLVYVVTPEDKNGNPVLSLSRAQAERDWRDAEKLFESGEIFEGTVAGYNKGGLIVRLGKVRGFVPSSQITSLKGRRRQSEDGEDPLAALVGNKMQLKVIEIERGRNRLILSERAAMREWRKQHKERLLAELQEGDIRKGEVISICDFGAFVDLGGADGLIHLSELSWRRVSHPSEVLKVGDEVEVYVLNVDRNRKRIGLSLKRLEPDPGSPITENHHIGQSVEDTVTVETTLAEQPIDAGRVYLKVEAHGQAYSFHVANAAEAWQPVAENVDGRILSTPVAGGFVGAYIGMYASSNGQPSDNFADFCWFEYTAVKA